MSKEIKVGTIEFGFDNKHNRQINPRGVIISNNSCVYYFECFFKKKSLLFNMPKVTEFKKEKKKNCLNFIIF